MQYLNKTHQESLVEIETIIVQKNDEFNEFIEKTNKENEEEFTGKDSII